MERRFTTTGVLLKEGKVLIAQRKGSTFDGLWEFPGGKNRYNEELKQTLKREWLEELNLKIKVNDNIFNYSFIHKDIEYIMQVFLVSLEEESSPSLFVHQNAKMVKIKDLSRYKMLDSDSRLRTFLIKYLS